METQTVSTSNERLTNHRVEINIMTNIKEVIIELSIDWINLNICNVEFKYNVYEIANNELGLNLFRVTNRTGFFSRELCCLMSFSKDLSFLIEVASFEPESTRKSNKAYILVEKRKTGWCSFSVKAVYDIREVYIINGAIHEIDKLGVISLEEKEGNLVYYLGKTEESMCYKVVAKKSLLNNNTWNILTSNLCRKNKSILFEVYNPASKSDYAEGLIIKEFKSALQNIDKDIMRINFPSDASNLEKIFLLALGNIVNMTFFHLD